MSRWQRVHCHDVSGRLLAVLLIVAGIGGLYGSSEASAASSVPTVSSVVPNEGPLGGGNTVEVTGTNFVQNKLNPPSYAGLTTVHFGSVSATVVSVNSTTQLYVDAPAGTGTDVVTVTTLSGKSSTIGNPNTNEYTYEPAPTITSVSPATGPATGGTSVTITGTNFEYAANDPLLPPEVTFNGVAATNVVVNTSTYKSITATTPAVAASSPPAAVAVAVIVAGDELPANTVSAKDFTFYPAPTVTGISPSAGTTAGGTAITITGTGFYSGATSPLTIGGTAATSIDFVSSTEITAVTPAHAAGASTAVVTTPGGTASVAYTYYGAPTVTSVTPNAGSPTASTSVTITGTSFYGTPTVEFVGSGGTGQQAATNVVLQTGSSTIITATGPAQGTLSQVVDVIVTTPSGASAATAGDEFAYGVPVVSKVSPDGVSSGTKTASITITGTGFVPGSTVVFDSGSSDPASATSISVVSSTQITATSPVQGSGWPSVVPVTVSNSYGPSLGSVAATFAYAVPTVTSVSPSAGPAAGGQSVTINGTNFAGGTTPSVTFNGVAATAVVVVSATQITAVTPAGTANTPPAAINVVVTTGSGASATADDYTYYAVPTVTGVSPDGGSASGGTSVTITGTNLYSSAPVATPVQFNGTAATNVTFVSSTSITATSPSLGATPPAFANVTVTTPGGTSSVSQGDQFAYGAPSVTVVSPDEGSSAGSTAVTLTGTGFVLGSSVKFGSTAGTSVVVVNPTTITVKSPAGTDMTSVNVTVTTPAGTSSASANSLFAYGAPSVSTVSPAYGSTTGGQSVTITGTGFIPGTSTVVKFGSVAAISTTVVSGTSITATSPAQSAASVNVTVTTAGGTSATGAGDTYTYDAPPTMTAISPSAGPTAGAQSVTISGTNFTSSPLTTVTFNGVGATVTYGSATSLTAKTPSASAGAATVVLSTPGGSVTSSTLYTYDAPPTMTAISPSAGPTAGAQSVTISGTNFTSSPLTTVTFNGVGATVTYGSATSLTAKTPSGSGGAATVVLSTPGGSVTSSTLYTYDAPPTVTSMTPAAGPNSGGNTVTIGGTNFVPGSTTLTFGTTPVSIATITSTQITANAPNQGAQPNTVIVSVTTPGGIATAPSGYTFDQAPAITSISPYSVALSTQTLITITGYGFTAGSVVKFGSTPGTLESESPGTLTVETPSEATSQTVTLSVTTPGGTATSGDDFVFGPPTVSSVSPNNGVVSTNVTVSGTGFTPDATVSWGTGANPNANVTFVSPTELVASSPGEAGQGSTETNPVDLIVNTAAGSSATTASDQFTFDDTNGCYSQSPCPYNYGQGYVTVGSNGSINVWGAAAVAGQYYGSFLTMSPARSVSDVVGEAPSEGGPGYCLLEDGANNGRVTCFGPTGSGDNPYSTVTYSLGCQAAGIAATHDDEGLWITDVCGDVYVTGDAGSDGGLSSLGVDVSNVTGITSLNESGQPGYCILSGAAAVYCFSNVAGYGHEAPDSGTFSTACSDDFPALASSDSVGYWVINTCGYVYQDPNHGAPQEGQVNQGVSPYAISSIAGTADGQGYWLLGSDGSVWEFGDAHEESSVIGDGGSSSVGEIAIGIDS